VTELFTEAIMARTLIALVTILLATASSGAQVAQAPVEPCPPAPAASSGIDPATALVLLDRIQTVLDEAVEGESPTEVAPARTSGSKRAAADGKIQIERSLVDEMRAEVGQIRTLLKK
jgi:hypothetical protein